MTSKRGFASMTPEQRRRISAMGGKAVPDSKRSFSRNPRLASNAGRKGGMAVKPESRIFSKDREFASKCGRKGGQISKRKKDPKDEESPTAD